MKTKQTSESWRPKKDNFFVKSNPQNKKNSLKDSSIKDHPSTSSSSGFFVSPEEKNKILSEKLNLKKNRNRNDTKQQEQNIKVDSDKKPFDKKKWRVKKYSKKYKLQQWEEKRKQILLRKYYKQVKHDKPGFDVKKIYEEYDDESSEVNNPLVDDIAPEEIENDNNANFCLQKNNDNNNSDATLNAKQKKKKFLKNAQSHFEMIKEEKQKKKEEFLKKKAEKEAARKEYKKKKLEKYKKLSKTTKKGQPIMKYRMEMLLEQIEKSLQH